MIGNAVVRCAILFSFLFDLEMVWGPAEPVMVRAGRKRGGKRNG